MREIKFRAWDKQEKKMQYNDDITIMVKWTTDEPLPLNRNFEENDLQLMLQYTGLKDKNGKEIYEGDIVEYFEEYMDGSMDDESQIEEIEYIDGCFYPIGNSLYSGNNIEVIGNIYENPELLEAK